MLPILDRSLFEQLAPRSRWHQRLPTLAAIALAVPVSLGAIGFFVLAPGPSPHAVVAAAAISQAEPPHTAIADIAVPATTTLPAVVQPTPAAPQPLVVNQAITEQAQLPATDTVTRAEFEASIASLRTDLLSIISSSLPKAYTFSGPAPTTPVSTATFSYSQKIDQLSGTSLSNITVSGVTGLTDADVPDGITASNYFPLTGGTVGSTTVSSLNQTRFADQYSGANAGAKIAAAIADLPSSGGVVDARGLLGAQTITSDPFTGNATPVTLILGPATFTTSVTIKPNSNAIIQGAGRGITTLRLADSSDVPVIANSDTTSGNSYIQIRDLTIDGNGSNQTTGSNILFQNLTHFRIENLEILNAHDHGIAINNGTSEGAIIGNRIDNEIVGSGIRLGETPPGGQATDIIISGNYIANSQAANGIFILGNTNSGSYGTTRITITGNILLNNVDTSIEVGQASHNISVTNNEVDITGSPNGSTGIMVRAAKNVTVTGNTVLGDSSKTNQDCIFVWNGSPDATTVDNLVIASNAVRNCGRYGIQINSGDDILLTGNKSQGSGSANYFIGGTVTNIRRFGNDDDVFLSPNTITFSTTTVFSSNVGIGTTSPSASLHVYNAGGASTQDLILESSLASANEGLSIRNSAQNWSLAVRGADLSNAFNIRNITAGSDAFTVTTAGNVGIGTTSPFKTLSVAGSGILSQNSVTLQLQSPVASTNATLQLLNSSQTWSIAVRGSDLNSSFAVRDTTNASDRFVITTSGNVGFATTTPWRKLSVTGTVGFDGLTSSTGAGSLCLTANREVVYNSASDACLPSLRETKHDISSLSLDALEIVDTLDPVSFVYNDGDGRVRYGFIAEDTASVDPHLVTYSASGTLSGIDDRSIISIVVKAIQELMARVQGFADRFATSELTFVRGEGDTLSTSELTTEKLCIGSTCVTETQLQALLANTGNANGSPAPVEEDDAIDTEAPTITISGNNPALISVGDMYNDLGVTVTDNVDLNLGYQIFVGSTPIDQAMIDTSEPNEWHIHYVATDNAGNTATSTRTVIVEAPSIVPSDAPVEEPEGEVTEELGPEEEPIAS